MPLCPYKAHNKRFNPPVFHLLVHVAGVLHNTGLPKGDIICTYFVVSNNQSVNMYRCPMYTGVYVCTSYDTHSGKHYESVLSYCTLWLLQGAREFVVPTNTKSKFYSLVQSPQQVRCGLDSSLSRAILVTCGKGLAWSGEEMGITVTPPTHHPPYSNAFSQLSLSVCMYVVQADAHGWWVGPILPVCSLLQR